MIRARCRQVRRAGLILGMAVVTLGLVGAAAAEGATQERETAARLATFDAAWRLVRDTHFDPDFNGVDWNRLREELRPRAAGATSDVELRAVIGDLLGRLGQSHFALLPSDAVDEDAGGTSAGHGSGDLGMDVRLIEGRVTVTSLRAGGPADAAGIRVGWVLDAIDGASLAALLERVPPALDPRMATLTAWRMVTRRLAGPPGSAARLDVFDGAGTRLTRQVRRVEPPGEIVTVGSLPTVLASLSRHWVETASGGRIGLIRFNVWMAPIDAEFGDAIDQFRRADGIVVDLRGNPGGLAAMLMGISGHFLDEPLALGTMRTREGELRFVANPRRVNRAGERVTPYAGPVAILVDELTGSASECFAGGMQSIGRARVFGRRSLGQALPALFDRLPNGDVLVHAYGDFVTSAGVRLEGRGVAPDETVPLTREDLLAGIDRPLTAALAWIEEVRR